MLPLRPAPGQPKIKKAETRPYRYSLYTKYILFHSSQIENCEKKPSIKRRPRPKSLKFDGKGVPPDQKTTLKSAFLAVGKPVKSSKRAWFWSKIAWLAPPARLWFFRVFRRRYRWIEVTVSTP